MFLTAFQEQKMLNYIFTVDAYCVELGGTGCLGSYLGGGWSVGEGRQKRRPVLEATTKFMGAMGKKNVGQIWKGNSSTFIWTGECFYN